MSIEPLPINDDQHPPIVTDTDCICSSDVDRPIHSNSSQFSLTSSSSSFNEPRRRSSRKQQRVRSRQTSYPSVGQLLWENGESYSDVRLSFEDKGILAMEAGIPTELRLHSIVLFQSQFFKEQLSHTSTNVPSSPASNVIREKQIIVRLPARVAEEDMVNFYCTLKLMYTKAWNSELANNLAKGVGCLSVCCEIGFHEGIAECWAWLVQKCTRDKNNEMMRRLIEAYPDLYEKFDDQTSSLSTPDSSHLQIPIPQKSSPKQRPPPISRRSSSRRKTRTAPHARRRAGATAPSSSPILRSNYSDESMSTNASAPLTPTSDTSPHPFSRDNVLPSPSPSPLSPLPSPPSDSILSSLPPKKRAIDKTINTTTNGANIVTTTYLFPAMPAATPPNKFTSPRILNSWISKFEMFAIMAKRACNNLPDEARLDNRCFPFLGYFVSAFESIHELAGQSLITSAEALDFTLRMLNVIKVEHTHYHTLHLPPPERPEQGTLSPPIVLHESLDVPLANILKFALVSKEQKHLCDYLWAPSNISNLMHLREILSDNGNAMDEDEFEEMDEVMGQESLLKAQRVSNVEHMVVGEKMAEVMREIRGQSYCL
ncbi:3306_t:CDS:1 [Paraglomus brasilianum]|uniref:3306_t:CDS:1 n=1 Tax=Paraglomus brasilianum TaxID=144538 RepID=A0A9N9F761_9GLOM|nr:3306_t:CDS:1 [Paraglomus brasilianum]